MALNCKIASKQTRDVFSCCLRLDIGLRLLLVISQSNWTWTMFRRVTRVLSRWTNLILACAGLFCLMEGRACAGCRDHTLPQFPTFEPRSNDRPRSSLPPLRSLSTMPCGECSDRSPLQGDQPCRSPLCSGSPRPHGMPVTSINVQRTHDTWNLCQKLALPNLPELIERVGSSQSIDPIPRTDSIFHPPRPA